ncbi:23S rRNA (guanosine(2251)-2'-O)-methyltransferase RlmB [Hahella sp. KA22]|nr:23S rRNA (guanosine(2251)-2'-O)-methyltransferase RlmB [Hahella sp. KA22]AZZ93750.1 23S rRNA (guanosine(2251)-2'-O)-methyltransferase RlmB [Hahella sp. KA22]QAY57124.1 23S rRNA (guanosine(2251)-2'-O)-methyltransferase RlmB [Hahella sp. KA22]
MSESNIVFGMHAVRALLQKHPGKIDRLLLSEQRHDHRLQEIAQLAQERRVPFTQVGKSALDKAADGAHQGVVAYLKADRMSNETDLEELLEKLEEPALLLVLDGVTDPHNLGACLRSANAAGVHAVIVPKDKSAPLNAAARKVACGAAEVTPLIRVTNLARTLKHIQTYGVWLVGAAGEAEQSLYQADLKGSIAIVMGAEDKGMRRLTRENCDSLVNIPMLGEVSSLNVSVATGVCLFEVVRQRQFG